MNQYIKCPPDHLLVIHGQISPNPNERFKVVTSGRTFVFPIIQDYMLIDTRPKSIRLEHAATTKDRQNIITKIELVGNVSRAEKQALTIAKRFHKSSKEEIKQVIENELKVATEYCASQFTLEEFETNASNSSEKIKTNIQEALLKIGVEIDSFKDVSVNKKIQ